MIKPSDEKFFEPDDTHEGNALEESIIRKRMNDSITAQLKANNKKYKTPRGLALNATKSEKVNLFKVDNLNRLISTHKMKSSAAICTNS